MTENDPPRFDGYTPRKKRERLTEEEEARDRFRHAWPAFALVAVGAFFLIAFGIISGVLNGVGPIAGAIGAVTGVAYGFLRFQGFFGRSSEE